MVAVITRGRGRGNGDIWNVPGNWNVPNSCHIDGIAILDSEDPQNHRNLVSDGGEEMHFKFKNVILKTQKHISQNQSLY